MTYFIQTCCLGDRMDIASISALVAAVGVIVGVVFTVMELRNLVRQRQTDLTMRLYQHFGTKEFMDSYWQVITSEGKDDSEYAKKHGGKEIFHVSVFFEGVGILLRRKLIDINMAADLFSESIKGIWEKNAAVLEGITEQCNLRGGFQWFEYLYNELQKREQTLQQTQQ